MKWLFAVAAAFLVAGCNTTGVDQYGLVAYHQPEAWLLDTESNCKVNRYYIPDAVSVRWSGQCIDGFAIGEGVLTWVEDSGIEGMHQTCLQPDHPMSACKMGGGGVG